MKKYVIMLGIIFIAAFLNADGYQAGDDNLLIMPTAYTMEAGQLYFSDYELLFIDYHFAITSNISLGCASLFPITTHFLETITVRARFKYLDLNQFKSTLWTTFIVKPSILVLGNVFSIGKKQTSLHAGFGSIFDPNSNGVNVFLGMLGIRLDASKSISLFGEFIHTSSGVSVSDGAFDGYLSFGIRFRGDKLSWEIGGIRPLSVNTSELLFFPIIKATIML